MPRGRCRAPGESFRVLASACDSIGPPGDEGHLARPGPSRAPAGCEANLRDRDTSRASRLTAVPDTGRAPPRIPAGRSQGVRSRSHPPGAARTSAAAGPVPQAGELLPRTVVRTGAELGERFVDVRPEVLVRGVATPVAHQPPVLRQQP